MKITNKKSKMFAFGLAIVLFVALLQIFFLVNTVMGELKGRAAIGANQVSLFHAIQEGEKSMLYGEVGFRLAFQQALYDVVKGGGNAEESDCGKFLFFNLWRESKDNECYPMNDAVREKVAERTLDLLNSKYIQNNPYNELIGRLRNNHEVFIEQKDDKLIARAYAFTPERNTIICRYGYDPYMIFDTKIAHMRFKKVITSPFAKERTGICGRYYYYPSFRKEIKFDMNSFADASSAAKEFADDVQACIDGGNSTRRCVFEKLPQHPKISKDCFEGVSEVFYAFVDNYVKNLESPKEDCVFFFSPPQLINVDEETVVRIRIVSERGKTFIRAQELGFEYEVDARGPYFAEYYNDSENPYELEEEIQYVITYNKEGNLANQEINYGEGGFFSADWNLPGNIMFYKEEPGKVVFIDSDDYGEFNEVRFCFPQRENTFSFCYDTENKVMAYNEETEELAMQDLKIMFALSFP